MNLNKNLLCSGVVGLYMQLNGLRCGFRRFVI